MLIRTAYQALLIVALSVGLSIVLSSCEKSSNKVNSSLSQQVHILDFTCTQCVIEQGQTSSLRWRTNLSADTKVELKVIGIDAPLSSNGELTIQPSMSQVYTLTATDQQGIQTSASITVDVIQKPHVKKSFPILFVTQTPIDRDQNGRLSAFANHQTAPDKVPRGGDLMLVYPDGRLRNLTAEAGFGNDGLQAEKAIAVREPAVHWSGKKAVFSMLIGAPLASEKNTSSVHSTPPNPLHSARWQIYEISDFLNDESGATKSTVRPNIVRVDGQDTQYNNLSPIYGSDGSIIFTSDRPLNGAPDLYPQLDEYEATPSVTGIWKLHANKRLQLLNHTPSGAFNPIIDSFGRLLFTRWDHLQQDQLADRDRDASKNGVALPFKSFNFSDESANAKALANREEFFPESRVGQTGKYGRVSAFRSNFFTLWQMNQDGSSEETLNHIGLHEFVFGYLTPSFMDDPHLSNQTANHLHQNRLSVRREGGLFHLREDPLQAGVYYAINARESGSFTTDTIVRVQAHPGINPEQVSVTAVTSPVNTDNLPEGRFRNPLPLSDGRLVASHTSAHLPPEQEQFLPDLRLRYLSFDQKKSYYVPQQMLTKGIRKKLKWWDGKRVQEYEGNLWELDAVEVRPQEQVQRATTPLEAPERAVLAEENISEAQLRQWLSERQLALIVTRDQTSRDRADLQQPYNLRVPGGKQSLSITNPTAKVYDISHFQIVQAEQLRAYVDRPGRRYLAQPIKEFAAENLAPNSKRPELQSSVKIAQDGSTAAFVPTGRALSWQTTDADGNPVVRERNWITFQAGEIRTCAACHGINSKNQAGFAPSMNKPEALRNLLKEWKKSLKSQQK